MIKNQLKLGFNYQLPILPELVKGGVSTLAYYLQGEITKIYINTMFKHWEKH